MYLKAIIVFATVGAVSTRSILPVKRQAVDPPFIPISIDYPPRGYVNAGCYSDSWSRTITNSVSVTGPFTRDSCVTACADGGYTYAGVENGNECYCSNDVAPTGLKTSDAECLIPCSGDSAQFCGGGWRVNVYQNPNQGTLNWAPAGWSSLGCYTDSWPGARTLVGSSYTLNNMASTTDCIFTCLQGNFRFAGVEYGNECYCSNTVASTGTPALGSDCSTPCAGSPQNNCGGGWRLDIHWNNYWNNATTSP